MKYLILVASFVCGFAVGVKVTDYEIEEIEMRLHKIEYAPYWGHPQYYDCNLKPHNRGRIEYTCCNHRQYPQRGRANPKAGTGTEHGC